MTIATHAAVVASRTRPQERMSYAAIGASVRRVVSRGRDTVSFPRFT